MAFTGEARPTRSCEVRTYRLRDPLPVGGADPWVHGQRQDLAARGIAAPEGARAHALEDAKVVERLAVVDPRVDPGRIQVGPQPVAPLPEDAHRVLVPGVLEA